MEDDQEVTTIINCNVCNHHEVLFHTPCEPSELAKFKAIT